MHGIRRSVPGLFSVAAIIFAAYLPANVHAQAFPFTWDQAAVYSISIDRNTGGFTGITDTVASGYFRELGVNTILLSEPYGPVQAGDKDATGSDASNSSGSIDYTVPNASFGSPADFGDLVTAAHLAGLRVLIRIRLGTSPDVTRPGSGDVGADTTAIIGSSLHDAWSGEKVSREESELSAYFQRTSLPETKPFAQVKWLVDWIRLYGIDGFYVLDVENVDPAVSLALRSQSQRALTLWKSLHPEQTLDDSSFWMAGSGPAQALERGPAFDRGYNALASDHLLASMHAGKTLDEIYTAFAAAINSDPTFNILSSISFSDPEPNNLESSMSSVAALLMAPGSVRLLSDSSSGEADGLPDIDLEIWKKLGSFRARHPAVAAGSHVRISDTPYAFFRSAKISGRMDEVLIVMGTPGRIRLTVSRVLPDDSVVKDALTGTIGIVSFGQLSMRVGDTGMLLLELVR